MYLKKIHNIYSVKKLNVIITIILTSYNIINFEIFKGKQERTKHSTFILNQIFFLICIIFLMNFGQIDKC